MVSRHDCFRYALVIIFMVATIVFFLFHVQKNRALQRAQLIYNVLDKHRITYDIDAHAMNPSFDTTPKAITGVAECVQRMKQFVMYKEPVKLVLVGFPFKSPNHDKKTLSAMPDMAERKSFEYLQGILDEVKAVYTPGAKLTVFCDGMAFADILGVAKHDVVAYENALRQLVIDLPDIMLCTSTEDFVYENLETSVQQANEVTRKRLDLEFDYAEGRKLLAYQTIDDVAGKMASREARLRMYLSKKFPSDQYLRLTVHFSDDVNKKLGIRISPSDVTPYHGALVDDGNSWSIQFKKDIDHKRYELMTQKVNDIDCLYFKRR